MTNIISALRQVFGLPRYRLIGIASFMVFFAINLVALSTPIADEAFTAAFLRAVTATVILKSLFMSALLGVLTPFTVYLLRQRARAHLGASSAGLLCSGVFCLLGPLCCGAISIIIGWIAGLLPATAAYESRVYAFLGRYEALFFYISVVLFVYALYMNSRKIAGIESRSI